MKLIQDLSKQINFNNLTCHYKGTTAPKKFVAFKSPLGIYENAKGCVTLEKAEGKEK